MSYYTVIEDVEIDNSNNMGNNNNLDDLPAFNDWATLVVILVLIAGFFSSILYSNSLDNHDFVKLKKIEEVDFPS